MLKRLHAWGAIGEGRILAVGPRIPRPSSRAGWAWENPRRESDVVPLENPCLIGPRAGPPGLGGSRAWGLEGGLAHENRNKPAV